MEGLACSDLDTKSIELFKLLHPHLSVYLDWPKGSFKIHTASLELYDSLFLEKKGVLLS